MFPDLVGDLSTHLNHHGRGTRGLASGDATTGPKWTRGVRSRPRCDELRYAGMGLRRGRGTADPRRVLRRGRNFLDTANIYAGGDSERILGRPVAGRRSEFVIASKVGLTLPGQSSGLAPDAIRAALLATLGRLGTDYLDLLQIHASTRALPNANSPLLERV